MKGRNDSMYLLYVLDLQVGSWQEEEVFLVFLPKQQATLNLADGDAQLPSPLHAWQRLATWQMGLCMSSLSFPFRALLSF